MGVVDPMVEAVMMDKERTTRWESTDALISSSGSHLGLRFR